MADEQNSSVEGIIYLSDDLSDDVFIDENQASSSTVPVAVSAAVAAISQVPTMISSSTSSSTPPRRITMNETDILFLLHRKNIERLEAEMDSEVIPDVKKYIESMSNEELVNTDADGDTILLLLLSNREEFTIWKEFLQPIVEKLFNIPGSLEKKNNKGENALYLAAINFPERPYVFGYLATLMLIKGIDMHKKIDNLGNTIMHCIAAQGDSHAKVLEEMLIILKFYLALGFKCNDNNETALHVAVTHHLANPTCTPALKMTKMLLENGIDLKAVEKQDKNTALHLAVWLHCDPDLVKVLTEFADSTIIGMENSMRNNPLHLAWAQEETINLDKQIEVCRLLIDTSYNMNMHSRNRRPL